MLVYNSQGVCVQKLLDGVIETPWAFADVHDGTAWVIDRNS